MVRTDTEDLPVLDRGILRPSSSVKCSACRILLWLAIFVVIAVAILSANGCAPTPRPPAEVGPCKDVDPLKAWLVYGVLVGIVGVGVGVAMFIWLPFKKTAIAICGGAGAIIGTSLTIRSVLPYMEWIVLGSATVAVVALLWHNRKLFTAARESWNHVPDDAPVSPRIEAFLNRIVK